MQRFRQLTASDVNFAIVRPLVFKYAKLDNLAVVYACLVVRSHFINLVDDNLADANIMASRAMMCELLAIKLVRHFANDKIQLASVLTTSWSPVAGAPPGIVNEVRRSLGGDERERNTGISCLGRGTCVAEDLFEKHRVVAHARSAPKNRHRV